MEATPPEINGSFGALDMSPEERKRATSDAQGIPEGDAKKKLRSSASVGLV